MAFQNAQQPTEEPWGPNISEEQSDDEAAGGGVDLDATEEQDNDEGISYFDFTSDEESEGGSNEESEGGGEAARQCFRLPVSPVVREHLQCIIDGEKKKKEEEKKKKKKKKSCLENLKVSDWLHENDDLFPVFRKEDALAFIRNILCLPPEMSADKIEELFVRSPGLLRAVLLTVHCYATHSIQCMTPEPALELAYLVWVFPWNAELRIMLNTVQ